MRDVSNGYFIKRAFITKENTFSGESVILSYSGRAHHPHTRTNKTYNTYDDDKKNDDVACIFKCKQTDKRAS